jgi:hypothetical protein
LDCSFTAAQKVFLGVYAAYTAYNQRKEGEENDKDNAILNRLDFEWIQVGLQESK